MKNNCHKLQFLVVISVLLCLPCTAFAQLSDISWRAAEELRHLSGNNIIEYDDDGFVSSIWLDEIPGGFLMGQLEVFPKLESFTVDSRYYFEDSMMAGVGKLTNLKSFTMKNARYATSAVIELLSEVPKLEKLEINYCSEISSLHELIRLRHLKELTISSSNELSYTPLIECRKLETLRLEDADLIEDAAMQELARVTSLKTLEVNSDTITDEGLIAIGQLPNLEKLNLAGCSTVTGDGFAEFQHPETLKELNLNSMTSLSDEGLLETKRFVNLERLNLYRYGKVKGKGYECLGAFKKLKTLYCPETRISDQHLELLDGIESLEKIWLHGCRDVSGRGIDFLSKSQGCKSISLNECRKINSPDFDVLAKFKNLEELFIAQTRIRPQGIEQLCQLKKLKVLNICSNVWLDDTAFEKLQSCTAKQLIATGLPRTTDGCLAFASKMPNLTNLKITANRKLVGEGFSKLIGSEKITELSIESSDHLSLGSFTHIQQIPNLAGLTFSGDVTIAHLEQLSGMKKLKTLSYDTKQSLYGSERLVAILKTFPKLNLQD